MRIYQKYDIWNLAHTFILKVYHISRDFPKDEIYGLRSQLRRASASINLNFVEGCGRETDTEFRRFLNIALGSAFETEYILLLSKDLGYLNDEIYFELNNEVEKIKMKLTKLIQKLDNDIKFNQNKS